MLERSGLAGELRRPEISYAEVAKRRPADAPTLPPSLRAEVECMVKYHGYIERQLREIERSHELEAVSLPPELDYSTMTALSHEVREKLLAVRPATLGQAARIPGLTPAAISILAVHVKRARAERPRDAESRAG